MPRIRASVVYAFPDHQEIIEVLCPLGTTVRGAIEQSEICDRYPEINLDNQDPRCELKQVVANEHRDMGKVNYILNNSFGMLGINSVVIVKKYE